MMLMIMFMMMADEEYDDVDDGDDLQLTELQESALTTLGTN